MHQKTQISDQSECFQSPNSQKKVDVYKQGNEATAVQSPYGGSLIRIIRPNQFLDVDMASEEIKPPHLLLSTSSPTDQNMYQSPSPWNQSDDFGKVQKSENGHNQMLREIEMDVQKQIKGIKMQQTSLKKPQKSKFANSSKMVDQAVAAKAVGFTSSPLASNSRQNDSKLMPQGNSCELESASRSNNLWSTESKNDLMKDNQVQRTPAFPRDLEKKERQLQKRIKYGLEQFEIQGSEIQRLLAKRQNKAQIQLPRSAQKRQQIYQSAKKCNNRAQIEDFVKFVTRKQYNKKSDANQQLKESKDKGSNDKIVTSKSDKYQGCKSESSSDSTYSHHQYERISEEYFERSLSKESSQGRIEVIECRSEYVIQKQSQRINQQSIMNFKDKLQKTKTSIEKIYLTSKKLAGAEADPVEEQMNQSVTDIQMGSAEADKKYGGAKDPIKLCRQSFFERPQINGYFNDQVQMRQISGENEYNFRQDTRQQHQMIDLSLAAQCNQKDQFLYFDQTNFAGRQKVIDYDYLSHSPNSCFSTPQNFIFEEERKQIEIDNQNEKILLQRQSIVQRRRLMQLYGCSSGTIATRMSQETKLSLNYYQERRVNPTIDIHTLDISKFEECTCECDQVQPQDECECDDNSVKFEKVKQFQSMMSNQLSDLTGYRDQAKIDTENNHKDDKKVVITGQSAQPSAVHGNNSKGEVQRRLDFDNLPHYEEMDDYHHQSMISQPGLAKKYYMPQLPHQFAREQAKYGNYEMLKNRYQSVSQPNTYSAEKIAMRGHNLDMRLQADLFRAREFELLQNQAHFKHGGQIDSYEDLSNPRTPPFAKISRQRLEDNRQEYFTGAGSFVTQPSTQHAASSFNPRGGMGRHANDQFQFQTVSPYNQKYINSGNRQNYGVSRFIRRGATPHDQGCNNFMTSHFMMQGHQNSQRKAMRSAINEQRYSNFVQTSGSHKQKPAIRPSISSDHLEVQDGDNVGPQFQMVRPFESQHKDNMNSGYDSNEFKMPIICKSQTPQRTKLSSDEEQQEMIIPKDFSNQKFAKNSYKGGKVGQPTISSFGSIIGDSQVEPLELSNNQPLSRRSDSHRNNWYQHQYIESFKSMQAHQAMIKKCPVHGQNSSEIDEYKETMAIMAAQAHAYAQSCFMYFQLMAKLSKSQVERNYFLHQQAIAGCMVHGPHGDQPMHVNFQQPIPPPSLAGYPPYDPKTFSPSLMDQKDTMNQVHSNSELDKKATSDESCEQLQQAQKFQKEKSKDDLALDTKSKCEDGDNVPKKKPNQMGEKEERLQSNENQIVNATQKANEQEIRVNKPPVPTFDSSNMLPPPSYHQSKFFSERSKQQNPTFFEQNQHLMRPPIAMHDNSSGFSHQQQMFPGSGPSFLPNNMHAAPPHTRFIPSTSMLHPFYMQQQLQNFKRNKRNRKDPDTMRYLMQEFKKDPTWSKETYQRVARETGLSESQVYKWGWDQKNKKNEEESDEDAIETEKENEQIDQAQEKQSKDEKLLKLDLAISNVKIGTDEMNKQIMLPHEIHVETDVQESAKNGLKPSLNSEEENKGYNTDKQKLVKLGKRPLVDVSNTDQQSLTLTQASKQLKKRDSKYSFPKDSMSEATSKAKAAHITNSNATNYRSSQENINQHN